MKKIFVILMCVLLIATVYGATSIALACKPGGGGGKPPQEQPPADPTIAYVRETNKGTYLCVMNADGSNQVDIHTLASWAPLVVPSWSPDGDSIAFVDDSEIWRIDVEVIDGVPQGKNLQKLTTGGDYCRPAWSPTGDEILVVTDEYTSLGLVPATGGTSTIIYTAPEGYVVIGNTWSPDESQIVFVESNFDDIQPTKYNWMKILDLETNEVTVVFSWEHWECPCRLDWARTKDIVAFDLAGDGRWIYTLDLSEQSPTPEKIVMGMSPSWSPDDSKIVYEGGKRGNTLTVYDFATETTEKLGSGKVPDWSRA